MDADFVKYLQGFLKRYGVNTEGIDFDSGNDAKSMLKRLKTCNIATSEIQRHLEVISDLLEKNICIYKNNVTIKPLKSIL